MEISLVDKEIFNSIEISKNNLNLAFEETKKRWKEFLNNFAFNEALISIWDLISCCDKYLEEKRPWKASPNGWGDDIESKKVVSDIVFIIKEISKLLEPFLPETSDKILNQLKTKESKSLFPRI